MKKMAILSALSFFCIAAWAQQTNNLHRTFSPYSVSLQAGAFADIYFDLSLDELETRIKDDRYQRLDVSGFQSSDYAVTNSGLSFSANMRFGNENEGVFTNREFGLDVIAGREILINYYDGKPYVNSSFSYKYVTFCDMQNEIAVSAVQRIGFNGGDVMKFYTGIGGQLGTTVGSQFWVFSNLPKLGSNDEIFNEDVYNTRSSLFGRIYAPIGAEVVLLKKLSLGVESRIGYGRQQVVGGQSFGGINYAFRLSTSWIF